MGVKFFTLITDNELANRSKLLNIALKFSAVTPPTDARTTTDEKHPPDPLVSFSLGSVPRPGVFFSLGALCSWCAAAESVNAAASQQLLMPSCHFATKCGFVRPRGEKIPPFCLPSKWLIIRCESNSCKMSRKSEKEANCAIICVR